MRSLLLLLLLISSPVYAIVVTGEGFSLQGQNNKHLKKQLKKKSVSLSIQNVLLLQKTSYLVKS